LQSGYWQRLVSHSLFLQVHKGSMSTSAPITRARIIIIGGVTIIMLMGRAAA